MVRKSAAHGTNIKREKELSKKRVSPLVGLLIIQASWSE